MQYKSHWHFLIHFSWENISISDPKIKNHVKSYLASSNSPSSFHRENDTKSLSPTSSENSDNSSGGGHAKGHKISSSDSLARKSKIPVNSSRASSWSAPQSPQAQKVRHTSQIPTPNGSKISNFNQPHQEKEQQQTKMQPNKARFEAYMMTGDLILNLSRTPQNSDLLPATTKKVTVSVIFNYWYYIKFDSQTLSNYCRLTVYEILQIAKLQDEKTIVQLLMQNTIPVPHRLHLQISPSIIAIAQVAKTQIRWLAWSKSRNYVKKWKIHRM